MGKNDAIYRTLLESAAEGIIVIDLKGLIILANGKARDLFGYREGELVGQVVEVLLPESKREVHRLHRANYTAAPRDRSMGIGLDLVAIRRDGSEFPVEIALSHAGEGDDMVVMASVSDISWRKKQEEERSRLMEDRIRELETTLQHLEGIAGPPNASVTARMLGLLPLREAATAVFSELEQSYGLLLDEALERRVHKTGGNHAERAGDLAAQLGFLKATPRDLVDLHSGVIKEKCRMVPASRVRAYLDEGHFLLVEMIGNLATYYRNRALTVRDSASIPGRDGERKERVDVR